MKSSKPQRPETAPPPAPESASMKLEKDIRTALNEASGKVTLVEAIGSLYLHALLLAIEAKERMRRKQAARR